jgi:HSP20 family protein
MTFYLTPYGRRYMRRVMNQMNDMDEDLSSSGSEIVFPVDVRADDDKYIITALLPGISADDLSIQVVNETVTLQGEFKDDRKQGAAYLVQERPSGRFCRVIKLPERVDSGKADASMENGVLVLEVPKAEEVRPKTIKINAK